MAESRRVENKRRRRAAILDATLALLREAQFDDVTVDQIARAAGVSPHTVYNLVGTRADIIQALLARVVRQMSVGLAERAEDGNPVAPVYALFQDAIEAVTTEPAAYREVVAQGAALPEWPAEASTAPRLVASAVAHLDRAGGLRPEVSARFVTRHLYQGFVGWLLGWANGHISDEELRAGVCEHVSLVLAATAIDPIGAGARSTILAGRSG